MGSAAEEEAALSDFEEDDLEAAPVVLPAATNASVVESLKTALAELESERQARKAAEAAKAESDSSIVRLKGYIHEAIRQRDEAFRLKEEAMMGRDDRIKQLEDALHLKEEIGKQRDEALKQRDEATKQKDDILRQKDELSRFRESSRGEIEGVARMLVKQGEKITAMVSGVKNFSGGLPRSSEYTGLAAIAHGFGKRAEEVVDEVMRQREEAVKRRDEIHMQMEQRNLIIAIEVSQLEASITQLKDEVVKRSADVERWQKFATGKDVRIAELERSMVEQVDSMKQEAEIARKRAEENEGTLKILNSKIVEAAKSLANASEWIQRFPEQESENKLLPDQSDFALYGDNDQQLQSEFFSKVQALTDLCVRSLSSGNEMQKSWKSVTEELEATIDQLQEENKNLLVLLPKNISDKEISVDSDAQEDMVEGIVGLPAVGQELQQNLARGRDPEIVESDNISELSIEKTYAEADTAAEQDTIDHLRVKLGILEKERALAVAKGFALEEEIKRRTEELESALALARSDVERLHSQVTLQEKDIAARTVQLTELEEVTKEHIEDLSGELLAAEEEISRWKGAAKDEAVAGTAVQEEVEARNEEIAALNERVSELKALLEEANNKLWSKEEMAIAATAARTAAERSLQIADERAADLRQRLEQLSNQLDEIEQKGEYRIGGIFDLCWPWLCGRGRPGFVRPLRGEISIAEYSSAAMEQLMQPLV